MKIDPYKNKERYEKWKKEIKNKDIEGISKPNSDLLKNYIFDMEKGINVSITNKKGSRGSLRLNTLRTRLKFLLQNFEEKFKINDITKIKEEHLHEFFSDMRSGKIRKSDGKVYESTTDYVKVFKAFWHWYMKINRKNGELINDITIDLDTSKEKSKFVYFTETEFKKLVNKANYKYKVLMWFLFDTGIRSPSELVNIKVTDLYDSCKELMIRDEISKTFGRRIKLLLCSDLLREYIKDEKFKKEDYLFPVVPRAVNQYFKRLGKKVFNGKETLGGKNFSELTMYDFRHSSACYWLPRYKSEIALKFRFGWKQSDKIHYYTNLLGMSDTITKEDLLIDITKTELEQELEKEKKKRELLQEELKSMAQQINKFEKYIPLLRTLASSPKALGIIKEDMIR